MEPFLGQLQLFAFDYPPRGWLFAEGQVLGIAEYPDLFELLGFQFGGDGRTDFALPDLKGKEPVSGTHYCITLVSVAEEIRSEPFVGQIQLFAFDFVPPGWEVADGQTLGIATNIHLFELLHFRFGGDGRTNFDLPDLRGKEPAPNTRYCIALAGVLPPRS